MAETKTPTSPTMKPTLGLTGLTINAMALIAPGAFLWLTFEEQALYGAPLAGMSMWFGIVAALLLCLATAISYAELTKLYPGAGSSYFYAEQAFLSKPHAFKYARVIKFFTGWASHLYYWVYPGCMVGVTALLVGYISSQFWPDTFSSSYNSPLEMYIVCAVFAIGVSYIAFRGVTGTMVVNMAINIIQILALLVFSAIALAYHFQHPDGSQAIHLSNGVAINYQVATSDVTDDKGKGVPDSYADGSPIYAQDADRKVTADDLNKDKNKDGEGADRLAALTTLGLAVGDNYPAFDTKDGALVKDKDGKLSPTPSIKQSDRQVVADDLDPAKNKDAAVLASLKAMNLGVGDPYPVLTKGKDGKMTAAPFTLSNAATDAVTGKAGDPKNPLTFNFHTSASSVIAPHSFNFLFVQACVAILILVGFESVSSMGEEAINPKKDIPKAIVLSLVIQGAVCYLIEYFCANYFLNSGYTMVNAGASSAPIGDMMLITGTWLFGSASAGKAYMLIQAFTVFLALIGTTLSCLSTGARVTYAMGRDEELGAHFGLLHEKTLSPHRAIWTLGILSIFIGIATVTIYLGGASPAALDKHNIWYSFGIFANDAYAHLPNTLLIVTLVSNFGTFLLYMTTCIVAIVAFNEHHMFHGFKHLVVPIFGLVANFACMLFYIVGPFTVAGMSYKEPFYALGICLLFGIWGAIYFARTSKVKNRPAILTQKPA